MVFESFMANNCKFLELDDVITFINNICNERKDRTYIDNQWFEDISVEECFCKVMNTCGYGYTPDEEDLQIIWVIMNRLDQQDINRIFYKNNLYNFIDNPRVFKLVEDMILALKAPFLDPNEPPEEIKKECDDFWLLLKEFVYYKHMYIDKMNRLEFLPRKVAITID